MLSVRTAIVVAALLLFGILVGTAFAVTGDRSAAPCESASFTAHPDSPARAGTVIIFTPSGACGGAPAEFRWYVKIPGESGWSLVQNWSPGEFAWNTAGLQAGPANIDMYVRRVGRPRTEIDFSRGYILTQ